jgi:hypothetical protein
MFTTREMNLKHQKAIDASWWRGLVVTSPPAIEEKGVMGCEIESHQGIGWQLKKCFKKQLTPFSGYRKL